MQHTSDWSAFILHRGVIWRSAHVQVRLICEHLRRDSDAWA